MEALQLEILPAGLFRKYLHLVDDTLQQKFSELRDSNISTLNFSFYTSVAAVFSSKIEGENIEMDSFVKHKLTDAQFQPDYTQKTDDLYEAYQFAQRTLLNEEHILSAHSLITRHILKPAQQGIIRTWNMFVITTEGQIEYVACTPQQVKAELEKLYEDISYLIAAVLTIKEVFFFASMIHLVFVKIHPFQDGNGRTARLIEKWFIAEKLGQKAWLLQSEKHYYNQHATYYQYIIRLGIEYNNLNYNEALPFLLMLPQSL